ncbi:MAG: ChaN family lipoprotein [Polyangiaceae bacterium]|nr:ChaN family lipoprotein [Polyangiaceae bacterium]
MRAALVLFLALALGACTQTAARPAADVPRPNETPAPHAASAKPKVAPDVVESAAGAFVGQRVDGGELLSAEGLFDELSRADLICVGEEHGHARSHFAQWAVLGALVERSAMSGRSLALGLEMLPRSEQRALDRYLGFELEEDDFMREARWSWQWGWDFAFYRPQLELARHKGVPVLALNASRELTRSVARLGIEGLAREQQKQLPELDLADADHRAWFDGTMKGHPHGKADQLYAAQVVWDETMAESATRWLGGKLPGRQLVVLAGTGHCRGDAIPKRVRRRAPARVVSVRVAGTDAAKVGEWDFVITFE